MRLFKSLKTFFKKNVSSNITNNNNIVNYNNNIINRYEFNPDEILDAFKSELLKPSELDCIEILTKIIKKDEKIQNTNPKNHFRG